MKKVLYVVLFALMPLMAMAQFTIVDSESGDPIPGVFVFGSNGSLVCMSNDKGEVNGASGRVTLSMISYEPLSIDATGLTGEVKLVSQPLLLNEVVVGRTDYVKVSGVFRDVVGNEGRLVLYREGIMDFYYNVDKKDWTRRIRAARQLEDKNLRKLSYIDSLYAGYVPLFDLGSVRTLDSENEAQRGDTLVFAAKVGKAMVSDVAMIYKAGGLYHQVIDGVKANKKTSTSFLGMKSDYKVILTHWSYTDPAMKLSSLAAFRNYTVEEYRTGKKSPLIIADQTHDFVVTDVQYLTKKEAKEEMKDKETETNFQLPKCLPAVPEVLTDQIPMLVQTKVRKF